MRLLFVTDLHGARGMLARTAKHPRISSWKPDLVLVGGDFTSFGGPERAGPLVRQLRWHFGRVVAVAGNTDLPSVSDWLEEMGANLAGHGRSCHGVRIVGCQGSTPTPFSTPNEREEEVLEAELESGLAELGGGDGPLLVVSHVPPAGTSLDLVGGRHVGSRAVRRFLERHGPELCLCGHVHEAAGTDFVGRCRVFNPGPLSWGRVGLVEWEPGGPPRCEAVDVEAPFWYRVGHAVGDGLAKLCLLLRWRVRERRVREGT